MDEDLISKKELLERYGISYGALYRWKRMGLIPESWFLRRSTPNGQETYFHTKQICPRVERILESKERVSLEELAAELAGQKQADAGSGNKIRLENLSPRRAFTPVPGRGRTQNRYSGASEGGSIMNEHIDMKISGSSSMPGGEYGRVSISGAGRVNGSLKCEELHCSGASNVQGDVDCAGELRTSGAAKVAGSVRCGSLTASGAFSAQSVQVEGLASVSGSLRTEQALTADELRASGSLEAGSVHCRAFRTSGSCRVSGDIEAETAALSGAVQIGGLLNAETVEISANRAVHISAIGGGSIHVLQKDTATILGLFHTSPGCARIGSIEGDNIELENVEAEIVRGKYVRIGHGCRIGTVEFGENLEAEPGTVRQSTQTGTK